MIIDKLRISTHMHYGLGRYSYYMYCIYFYTIVLNYLFFHFSMWPSY